MHTHLHRSGVEERASAGHLSHLNVLFTGWGTQLYERVMVPLTSGLYHRVVADLASLQPIAGTVLDAGTGPGTLAREIARRFPQAQVYGVDLSEDMIRLAREHAQREQLAERVHFDTANVGHLPYPDGSFDVVVSTISMHHWYELEQPLRDLYRVLQPGGRLWIYDFRFVMPQTVEKALANTPFAGTPLQHTLVRTGALPFAFYQRFALQKPGR
ncbi:MAG: class I SAM-dependent methyltransferase [Ktedonobacterales bacterium]